MKDNNNLLEEYLEFAKDVAKYAGEVMLKYFKKNNGASYKGDKTIVTLADTEINSYLIKQVKEKYPSHCVDGEEEQFGKSDYVWVCDPVDGTAMYARHIPVAVFSLALVIEGQPIVGVVFDPFTNSLYTAIKGKGAYKNDIKLQVSQRDSIQDTVIEFGFPYNASKTENILKNVLKIKQAGAADVKRIGPACLDICRVASGECDAYFEYDLKPWDIMAAMLILQEAGGTLYKMDGTKYEFTQGSIIVSNKSEKLKKQLLELVN